MQAIEVRSAVEESQKAQKERNLAVDNYLRLLVFLTEELKKFSNSIAFQVFEPPENAEHAITILPNQIANLTELDKPTTWTVEIDIYASTMELNKALISNLNIVAALLPILGRFAKKHEMTYNTVLSSVDYDQHTLLVTFQKILSYE